MLQAMLRGKLSREQENLEDILTSTVFGLMQYLPADTGLLPLLSLARYQNDSSVEEFAAHAFTLTSMEFWPCFRAAGVRETEPDVALDLTQDRGTRYTVFVEVKLRSAKSSGPNDQPTEVGDQLARQWSILTERCIESGTRPVLVYVTADPRYPALDVNESAGEFHAKRPLLAARYPFACAWISWGDVALRFQHSLVPALRDIARLCKRLDLLPFQGIRSCSPRLSGWRFSQGSMRFNFAARPVLFDWRFR